MAIPVRIRRAMPVRGLNFALPSDTLQPENTPRCLNVHFRFNEVRPRPGASLVSGPVVAQEVREIREFTTFANLKWVVELSTQKIFRLGNTSPGTPREFHAILGGPAISAGRRWSTTAGEGFLFFTNDSIILKWDGVFSTAYAEVVDADASGIFVSNKPKARYVEYFNNRLILAYTDEMTVGVRLSRIRWPKSGDYTRWQDTTGVGAGFLDLYEEGEEAITGIRSLGDRCVIFKEHSIVDLIATGVLNPVHITQTRVRGLGCAAPYTLISNGLVLFFMGHDSNVYTWDGTQLVPIGQPILKELEMLVDPGAFHTYFAQAIHHRHEYWLVLDSSNVFVYDWINQSWTRDSFPSLTALGEVEDTQASTLWSTIPGTWQNQTATWDSLAGTEVATLMGGRSNGAIFRLDETVVYDYFAIGSIVDRYVETPDYYFNDDPWLLGTLKRLLLSYEFKNNEAFEIGVSLDRGQTWLTQNIVPVASGYSVVDFNVTGNVCRFRFRENNATGQFRWRHFAYEFIDAGPFRS